MDRRFSRQITQIGLLLLTLYLVQVISAVTAGWPLQFGVIPREVVGLRGILFSPLLHAGWAHLVANTAPLAVMLCFLAFSNPRRLWSITAAIWATTGACVWFVGRPHSLQVGASGVIFGLASYLVTAAWTTRHLRTGLAALAILVLYGSMVWGLLPGTPGVSWEGHLAGALAGFVLAKYASRRP